MANNDPIKDYNPASLKLEALQEKLEMYMDSDNPITDLHDCSNDLSDAGSRKEEYEHAKYSERIRQGKNIEIEYNANQLLNKIAKNSFILFAIIFIVMLVVIELTKIIIAMDSLSINIFNNSSEEYIEDEVIKSNENSKLYEKNEPSKFDLYINNIETKLLTTNENKTYVEVYNGNRESYGQLQLHLKFYDYYGNLIINNVKIINVLLGNNYHYFEVSETPLEYAYYEIKIEEEYAKKYIDISKDDFSIDLKEKSIVITNHYQDELYYLRVSVLYFNNDGLIDIETYNFPDLNFGDIREQEIYSNGIDKKGVKNIKFTIHDVCKRK